MLGLASCQNDFDDANVSVGGEVDFQLAVAAPELGATRADDGDQQYGHDSAFGAIDYLGDEADDLRVDWTDVDLRYSLEVYDVEKDYNASHVNPIKDRQVIIVDKYEPVTFELRLVPNRNYHFVVFADFVPQGADKVDGYNTSVNYQRELGLRHTIGNDLRSITLKNEAINDEVADAYFATLDVEIKNSAAQDMVLKRPYGKVRVVATDLHELNLNVDPAAVRVTYDAFNANGFNAVTGAISGKYETKQFVNLYNPVKKIYMDNHIYTGYNTDAYKVTSDNGVTRNKYMTIFTDYILAGADQHSIHFTMEVFQHGDSVDNLQNLIKSTSFNTDIPVQRNYLTTVIGNVLTTATEINVTIDDNFYNADNIEEAPYYQVAVTNGLECAKAILAGQEFIALNDIVVTAEDIAKAQTRSAAAINPVCNLNGFTITFVNDSNEPLFVLPAGSSFTITDGADNAGEFVLDGEGAGAAIVAEEGATLNINGGTIKNEGNADFVFEANGETNIAGGNLEEGALQNNGEVNITDGNIAGGAIENNGTTNITGDDAVVEEDAIENGENAIVGTYVYTAEELQAAINAAVKTDVVNEISFGANIVGDVTILQKEGVNLIINGRNFEFDGVITVNGGGRANGNETLTFKAINFATEGSDFTFISAPSKINGAYNYSHNVTIESCTFNGNQTVGSASFTGTYNFVMKDCKATNMHSILQLQSVDNNALVDNVETVNCKNGLSFGNTAYPTLKNSTIKASEYGVRADGDASRGALLLEANTIEANVPVIVRKTTTKYDVTLVNNTITKGGLFEVVFTNGKDDEAYVAPTGTYTLTGAENYVVFPYAQCVSTGEELVAAMQSSLTSTAILANDITMAAEQNSGYGKAGIVIEPGKTINGNGKTLKVTDAGATWDCAIYAKGGTIKNLTVAQGFRGIFMGTASGNLFIENVTINGPVYAFNSDGGNKNYGVYLSECTINGWTSHSDVHKEVVYTNCTFGRANGYAFCRPYGPTTFVGCNFCEGYEIDARGVVKFENCTLNGVAVTAENLATLVTGNIQNAKTPSTVSTADELIAALENGKDVVFANDIKIEPASMSNAYGATGINVKYGQTIDGNGYTLNIKGAGGTWDSGINTTGGVIKNLTVTGSFRGIFINHTSEHYEKVVLENVTIGGNGTVYTISCDQGLYQGIEATNCTFNGWTSFAKTAGEAKFVNCNFGEGSTYKYCRPYSNTEFVGCTFCPGYAVDTTRATVTFTNCTWEE